MTLAGQALGGTERVPDTALTGIGWLLIGVACYAVMDTLTRLLGPAFGVALLMVIRYAVHTVAMGALLLQRRLQGSRVDHRANMPWQLLRGVLLFTAAGLAVLALQGMPVAEYTAVILVTPLLVTLLASVALKHKVSPLQWLLVAGGLGGALIVTRPGSGLFGAAALLALGVALGNAAYQTITNHLGAHEDAVTTNFHSGWVCLLLSLAWLCMTDSDAALHHLIHRSSGRDIALLLGMAALATVGQLGVITALGRGKPATLMPFAYTQIAFAAAAGWLILGDLPDAWSWIGMAVIAVCGASSAWTHRKSPGP